MTFDAEMWAVSLPPEHGWLQLSGCSTNAIGPLPSASLHPSTHSYYMSLYSFHIHPFNYSNKLLLTHIFIPIAQLRPKSQFGKIWKMTRAEIVEFCSQNLRNFQLPQSVALTRFFRKFEKIKFGYFPVKPIFFVAGLDAKLKPKHGRTQFEGLVAKIRCCPFNLTAEWHAQNYRC